MSDFKQEIITQTAHASPSITGVVITAVMGITLNQVFLGVSIAFVLLQAAYLIWKWRREVKKNA